MTSLYVDRRGVELRLDGEALVFYESGERIGTVPLAPLSRVFLKGDVMINTSLLGKLGERNIGVAILSGRRGNVSMLLAKPHNDAARRLKQYRKSLDEHFCLQFARSLVDKKIRAQANFLMRLKETYPKYRLELSIKHEQLLKICETSIQMVDQKERLRGIEGSAASIYFSGIARVAPNSLHFTGRNRRPPRDPLNSVLSLGYTLLHSEAVLALYGCGFDPFVGFYHAIDFGRESLASDIIEPLRPEVDAFCLRLFNKQKLRAEDFSTRNDGACLLGKAGRQRFYQHYEQLGEIIRKQLTDDIRELGLTVTGEAIEPLESTIDELHARDFENT